MKVKQGYSMLTWYYDRIQWYCAPAIILWIWFENIINLHQSSHRLRYAKPFIGINFNNQYHWHCTIGSTVNLLPLLRSLCCPLPPGPRPRCCCCCCRPSWFRVFFSGKATRAQTRGAQRWEWAAKRKKEGNEREERERVTVIEKRGIERARKEKQRMRFWNRNTMF